MAQPHSQAQQRPPFPQQSQSYGGYPQPNARQFSPQSPAASMSYSSPPPQAQFPSNYNAQAPPAKRPRLSPDGPSSFSTITITPQVDNPINVQTNGTSSHGAPSTSLMPPPQQPVVKRERDDDVNMLKDMGMDFGSESTSFTNYMPPSAPQRPFASGQGSMNIDNTNPQPNLSNGHGANATHPVLSQEERDRRIHQRQDWEEARHSQHELWDPFLYGATLNDKIKSISHKSALVEPQSGVLVNTQRNQPAPVVRVNGMEGATRVINQGQSILDTREKADRLNELVKLLSLSSRARITGLVQAAARLAVERRQHSQGRIPDEWSDVAIATTANEMEVQNIASPAANAGMKRTYSQANSESSPRLQFRAPAHHSVVEFEKSSAQELRAEEARKAKRRKRSEVVTAQENEASAAAEQEALAAAALESEKKTTKKERKMAEARVSDQQQHQSTNEAARMATANLYGRFGGANKKKNYSWMTGAGPGRAVSGTATPTRSSSGVPPPKDKTAHVQRGSEIGRFDEGSQPGIQARDLLLVLESDGRAAQAFVKGSSIVDGDAASRATDR